MTGLGMPPDRWATAQTLLRRSATYPSAAMVAKTTRIRVRVRRVVDPRESVLGLRQQHPGVVRQAHLVVPLERGRAHVGLVVAGSVTGVAHQVVQLVLGEVELRPQSLAVGVQLAADLVELLGGPRRLVRLDREALRGLLGTLARCGSVGRRLDR